MSSGSRLACCFGILAALLLCASASACTKSHDLRGPGLGGDEEDRDAAVQEEAGSGGSVAAGRSGAAGRSSVAGRGGSGGTGTAGRGGAGGRGGTAGGGSTPMCGSCPAPGFIAGLATATSCCTAAGLCGLTAPTLGVTTCQQLDAPGEPDDSCPGAVILGFLPLDGCCTPDGVCGANDDILGLGCAVVGGMGTPQRCTP